MQFSDASNLQGLIQDITFWTGMDVNTYTLKDRTRNCNRWYYDVFTKILQTEGAWEFDDTDKTDLPQLTTDMVDSQEDYELPKSLGTNSYTLQGGATGGGILKIHRVEVKDSNGLWVKLKQFDQRDINVALPEFMKTAGVPRYYDFRGNSVFLKPAPASAQVTLSAGLRLYISRELYTFTDTDTTREPGFAENFHRILSLGASKDWFDAKPGSGGDRAERVERRLAELMADLLKHYGSRNADRTARLRVRNMTGRLAR
jgi:hypothetical protein